MQNLDDISRRLFNVGAQAWYSTSLDADTRSAHQAEVQARREKELAAIQARAESAKEAKAKAAEEARARKEEIEREKKLAEELKREEKRLQKEREEVQREERRIKDVEARAAKAVLKREEAVRRAKEKAERQAIQAEERARKVEERAQKARRTVEARRAKAEEGGKLAEITKEAYQKRQAELAEQAKVHEAEARKAEEALKAKILEGQRQHQISFEALDLARQKYRLEKQADIRRTSTGHPPSQREISTVQQGLLRSFENDEEQSTTVEREAPASEDIVLSANINARIMKLIEEARQRHQSKVTSDGKERAQQPKSTPQGPLLSKSMPSRRPEAPLLAEEGPQAAKDDRQPEKEEGLPRKTGNHPARPGLDLVPDHPKAVHKVLLRHFGTPDKRSLVVRTRGRDPSGCVYISQSDSIPGRRLLQAAEETQATYRLRRLDLKAAASDDALYMQLVMDARAKAVSNLSSLVSKHGYDGIVQLSTFEPLADENGLFSLEGGKDFRLLQRALQMASPFETTKDRPWRTRTLP